MKNYKISDLTDKIIDNRGKTPPLNREGYYLLEINSIVGTNRHPNYSMVSKFVDKETFNSWFRAGHPIINDVLVSTVGTIGKFALVDREDICIAQNLVALRFNIVFYFLSFWEALLRYYHFSIEFWTALNSAGFLSKSALVNFKASSLE